MTFLPDSHLREQLRTYKEKLLPFGTRRRSSYDWCRYKFGAATQSSEQPEGKGAWQNSEAEAVRVGSDSFPVPPDDLCMRVGGTKGDKFLSQGASLQACLVHCLPEDFSWCGKRVFDFGCGVGRVLRHFAPQAAEAEFWASDIHEPNIGWLARNMGRTFRVIKTDAEPKLPFPSHHFDLIYSVSVFTHVHRHWDRWLEEIKRVLAPRGKFLCTFHNRIAYEWIMHKGFEEKAIGMKVYFKNRSWDSGDPQIFHSHWWVVKNWGKILPIEAIFKEGLVNWHSIALMQKGENSRNQPTSFFQPFPYSPWNPNFSGNLDYDALAPHSWIKEHGLRYRDRAEVRGWFSSAAGPIEDIRFSVDGLAIDPLELEKNPGIFTDTEPINLSFKAVLELSASSQGAHRGQVTGVDKVGNHHTIEFTLFRTASFPQEALPATRQI